MDCIEKSGERSILISSHISSDLETLCDDLYMIHQGKVIMHEDTDVLLSDYALLKVDEEEYSKLDRQYILRTKKESYGYSCLTNQKQYYAENYPQMAIEKGNIDEVITMMETESGIQVIMQKDSSRKLSTITRIYWSIKLYGIQPKIGISMQLL